MSLDLSALQKAIFSMKLIYERSQDKVKMAELDEVMHHAIQAGVIQHFEIVYELCWKFIQRWLKMNSTVDEATFPRTRKDLFRLAAKSGLITNPESWFIYANARNITSHTYNHEAADEVYAQAGFLLRDATALLKQLEQSS